MNFKDLRSARSILVEQSNSKDTEIEVSGGINKNSSTERLNIKPKLTLWKQN
jgi:hypothetical protein